MSRSLVASVSQSRLRSALDGLIANVAVPNFKYIYCDGCSSLDLLRMPSKTISLARFIALRHQWVSDHFFTIYKHDVGEEFYELILPSTTAPDQVAVDSQALKGGTDKNGRLAPTGGLYLEAGDLFQINDAFNWARPPPDDLASAAYWKDFRAQLADYEKFSLGECCNVELREKTLDDGRKVVRLRTLKNIEVGDELLLHYGRQWWTAVILRTVFMACSDEQIKDIRWIESLFANDEDRCVPFPIIVPKTLPGRVEASERLMLYDVATRKRATDSAVLAFSLRRSCKSEGFLRRLMIEVFGVGGDQEQPMKVLRRSLLRDLTGEPVLAPA